MSIDRLSLDRDLSSFRTALQASALISVEHVAIKRRLRELDTAIVGALHTVEGRAIRTHGHAHTRGHGSGFGRRNGNLKVMA